MPRGRPESKFEAAMFGFLIVSIISFINPVIIIIATILMIFTEIPSWKEWILIYFAAGIFGSLGALYENRTIISVRGDWADNEGRTVEADRVRTFVLNICGWIWIIGILLSHFI